MSRRSADLQVRFFAPSHERTWRSALPIVIAGGAPLQWRVFSCSFGPRASGSLRIMSEPEARGPEDHDAPLEWRAPSKTCVHQSEIRSARLAEIHSWAGTRTVPGSIGPPL